MRALSEVEEKEICRCEDNKCNFYPLKHFQKCPRCNSEAWHQAVQKTAEVKK